MKPDELLFIIFFFIPGFVSTEIARALRPEYQTKTGTDRIASVLLFSLLNYSIIGVNVTTAFTAGTTTTITHWNLLYSIVFSILTGMLWGIFGSNLLKATYGSMVKWRNPYGKSTYIGDKPLWDMVMQDYNNKQCIITTKNNEQFHGFIGKFSNSPQKESLFVKNITHYLLDGKQQEVNKTDLRHSAYGAYIAIDEIRHIIFFCNENPDSSQSG
jgi:hypothetical protein